MLGDTFPPQGQGWGKSVPDVLCPSHTGSLFDKQVPISRPAQTSLPHSEAMRREHEVALKQHFKGFPINVLKSERSMKGQLSPKEEMAQELPER